jgi:hypothetical protein
MSCILTSHLGSVIGIVCAASVSAVNTLPCRHLPAISFVPDTAAFVFASAFIEVVLSFSVAPSLLAHSPHKSTTQQQIA